MRFYWRSLDTERFVPCCVFSLSRETRREAILTDAASGLALCQQLKVPGLLAGRRGRGERGRGIPSLAAAASLVVSLASAGGGAHTHTVPPPAADSPALGGPDAGPIGNATGSI